jgi:pyruvate formate lyase activating enzyme
MQHEAMLYDKLADNKVQCRLCAHECKINNGKFGVCGVRANHGGTLYTLVYGDTIASHIDPIEKKPLYHFYPGSGSYSIATVGCNFKCSFCQNWQISQSNKKNGSGLAGISMSPEDVVNSAKKNKCKSIAYTYTEPTIYFEYAYDTAKLAKDEGIANVFVTNGFMTRDALKKINPYLDAANVDLKSFSNEFYKKMCGGKLHPVLDSIKMMKELGIWVEVTTLLVPGLNDSEDELNKIAKFIASVGKDIPWHISRYHPEYKHKSSPPTPIETMRKAEKIGKKQGLYYIYLGNVHEGLHTICHNCGELLIVREYMGLSKLEVKDGTCPICGTVVGGVF